MSGFSTPPDMKDSDFSELRGIIHKTTGITIGEGRKTMLVSRLRSRLRECNEPSFKAYIARLAKDPAELQELTNRVTTNETYFYRTPRVWSAFRQHVVAGFHAAEQARTMRVWSAAASTGEEAHTIAALLEEERLTRPKFEYSVLGTDISSKVLAVAEAGIYRGRSVARFQKEEPEIFARQMRGDEDKGFTLQPQAKARIKFKLHNLLKRLQGAGAFDVVFLRNVLIYFTKEDQETILRNVHSQMRADGTLFIGESETLTNLDTGFELVAPLVYRPVAKPSGGTQ